MSTEPFNPDFPLPVFGETSSSVWGLPEPVPSTILLALPGDTMPDEDQLRAALSVVGAEESRFVELDVPLNGPPFALWVMAIGLSEHPIPVIPNVKIKKTDLDLTGEGKTNYPIM